MGGIGMTISVGAIISAMDKLSRTKFYERNDFVI